MEDKILKVSNLEVTFKTKTKNLEAIRDISFDIGYGEIVGIVGESGSGKSVTMKSIMNILPSNGEITGGDVYFEDKNIIKMPKKEFRQIQGNELSMIFQDPMTALNPLKTIGYHITEILKKHKKLSKDEAFDEAVRLLEKVDIKEPKSKIKAYPHELSGGQRQRVMIAMALACSPKLLIADEPTTALDVTIQAQILNLIKKIQSENKMSVVLITHDLAVVYTICDKVVVMYGGKIMESGVKEEVFNAPKHPYTKALLESIPNDDSSKPLKPIEGVAPSLETMPKGCPFSPRCKYVTDKCTLNFPELQKYSDTHFAYCFKIDKGL